MATMVRRLVAALLVPGLLLSSGVAQASLGPVPDASAPWQLGPLELGSCAAFAHPEGRTSPVGEAGTRRGQPESGPSEGSGPAETPPCGSAAVTPAAASGTARPLATSAEAVEGWARLLRARSGHLSSPPTAPPVGPHVT